jgi:hypothetical protein
LTAPLLTQFLGLIHANPCPFKNNNIRHPPSQMALRRAGSAAPRVARPDAVPRRVLRAAATTIRPARLRCSPATAAAAQAAATSHSRRRVGDVLSWVASAAPGGFVHESLAVVAAASCGCRGVVATADIASGAPLIAVPEELTMSSQDALDVLSKQLQHQEGGAAAAVTKQLPQSAGGGGGATAATSITRPAPRGGGLLQQLLQGLLPQQHQDKSPAQLLTKVQPPMLLALLLAHQRRLGAASFWAPYISDLPEAPPCSWYSAVLPQVRAWDGPQQKEPAAAVAADGNKSASAKAAAAAAAVAAKCTAAAAVFGCALGGLTAEELAWAYGQVVSRAFSMGRPQPDSMALLPAIDMLNHLAGASVPVFLEQSEADGGCSSDGGGDGASSGAWCIWPQQLTERDVRGASSGKPAAGGQTSEGEEGGVVLRAGQELYISYMSSCDAPTALLSFGFCPAELQQA